MYKTAKHISNKLFTSLIASLVKYLLEMCIYTTRQTILCLYGGSDNWIYGWMAKKGLLRKLYTNQQ